MSIILSQQRFRDCYISAFSNGKWSNGPYISNLYLMNCSYSIGETTSTLWMLSYLNPRLKSNNNSAGWLPQLLRSSNNCKLFINSRSNR